MFLTTENLFLIQTYIIFFKVPSNGLVFNVVTNSTSQCGLEKKYNLFNYRDVMYFAGFSGQLIIKINKDNQWTILKINFEAEEPSIIGFIKKKIEYPRPDLTSIIGYNTVNCYIPEKNETVSELFKVTNVSKNKKQIFCLKYMLLVGLPGLARVHPPATLLNI